MTNRLKQYYKNYNRHFFVDLKRHQRICNTDTFSQRFIAVHVEA